MIEKILYLGNDLLSSTSRHRADALRRLGCDVAVIDPSRLLDPGRNLQDFVDYRSGYRFLQSKLLRALLQILLRLKRAPDLIWVNGGELLGPSVVQCLRRLAGCPIILYQNDDPTGFRDRARFFSLRSAIPMYDLCVSVRTETALEFLALGASQVLRVLPSYDEVLQTRQPLPSPQAIESVVSFIGTFIKGEHRDRFLLHLMRGGLPLRLVGKRWKRSRHWPELQTIFASSARIGAAYTQAIASSAISLGMLSHRNRDLVTRRSVETPAYGGLLCAERTSEHQLLYEEGCEASFWDSEYECAEECQRLLSDTSLSDHLRVNGHRHVASLGVGNEDICRFILAFL